MLEEPLLALRDFADRITPLGVPYVVGGSLASGSWGEPRSTYDTDVMVRLEPDQAAALFQALSDRFHLSLEDVRDAIRDARAFNLIHLGIYQKLDVFVQGTGPLDVAQMETRTMRKLEPEASDLYPVTSAEVMVIRKLDWFRRTGETSERQWRDVLAILRVQKESLDFEFARSLGLRCELEDLFDRAVSQC